MLQEKVILVRVERKEKFRINEAMRCRYWRRNRATKIRNPRSDLFHCLFSELFWLKKSASTLQSEKKPMRCTDWKPSD